MKPGHELDILVAKKVMKLSLEYIDVQNDGKHVWYSHDNDFFTTPSYSTDIEAAWEVLGKLWELEVTHYKSGVFRHYDLVSDKHWWTCDIFTEKVHVQASSDTAPHAICLAALKAVGVEV